MRRRPASPGVLVPLLLAVACAGAPPAPEVAAWRFGVAAFDHVDPLAAAGQLAGIGFDYVEPALSKLAALPDAEVEAARTRLLATGVRAETMNWFVPGDIKLTGPAVDTGWITSYVERALAIAASFGTRVIVFGSPAARSHPEGFDRDEAGRQLVGFLRICAGVIAARGYDLVVAIEPLRRPESNLVNGLAEGLALARAVDRPQVKLVVDFYHLTFEGEDPDLVRTAGDWIVHVQLADPAARGFPRLPITDPRWPAFFAALRAIGYRGRLSIEAKSADLAADAPAALAFLRAAAAAR